MKLIILKILFVLIIFILHLHILADIAITQDMRLEPQLKNGFNVINYSADNKKLLTVAQDGTVQVIDATSGSIMRTIYTNLVLSPQYIATIPACFSNDDSKVAIITINPYSVTIYDINAGKKIGCINLNQPARSICFTPDGNNLLIILDTNVIMYKIADGTKLWTITGGFGPSSFKNTQLKMMSNKICLIKNIITRYDWKEADANTIAKYGKENETVGISNDNRMVIAINKSVPFKYRLWEKYRDTEQMREGSQLIGVSPIVNGRFQTNVRGWTMMNIDALTGKSSTSILTRQFTSCVSASLATATDTLAVCENSDNMNAPTGKLIVIKNADTNYEVKEIRPMSGNIQISPDGKFIINASVNTAFIINTDTGEMIKKLNIANTNAATLSSDGEEIATVSIIQNIGTGSRNPYCISILNLLNDTTTILKTGDTAKIRCSYADVQKSYLFLRHNENGNSIWNFKTGKCIQQVKPLINSPVSLITSNNNIDPITNSIDANDLWTIPKNILMVILQQENASKISSPDFKYQYCFSTDGNGLQIFQTEIGGNVYKLDDKVYCPTPAAFSPDSKSLLLPDINKSSLHLFDITTRQVTRKYNVPADIEVIEHTIFSPNGSYIAGMNTKRQTAIIWKSDSPDEYFRISLPDQIISSFTFTADSRQLILTFKNGIAICCDLKTKAITSHDIGLYGKTTGIHHFPQQKVIVITYSCGLVRLFGENNWELLGTLFDDQDGNWAIYDPQNNFETSNPDILDSLCGVIDGKAFSIKQLRQHYFTKGLLNKIIANSEKPEGGENIKANILPPKVDVKLPDGQNTVLVIRLSNRGGGIGATKVILNGNTMANLLREETPDNSGQDAIDTVDMAMNGSFLPGEINTVQIITSIADDSMQTKGEILYWHAPVLTEEKNVMLMPQSCHTSAITDIQISNDGIKALSTDVDGKVIIWNVASGEKQTEFARDTINSSIYTNAVFTPDGRMVATVSGSNVILWDIKSGKIIRKIKIPQLRPLGLNFMPTRQTLSFSPDGSLLTLSLDLYDYRMILFDIKTDAVIKDIPNTKVLMDAKNKQYIEITNNTMRTYQLANIMTPTPVNTSSIDIQQNSYYSVNADFTKIAIFTDGRLKIADLHTGNEIVNLQSQPIDGSKSINSNYKNRKSPVSINATGNRCAAMNNICGSTINLWDLDKNIKIKEYSLSGNDIQNSFCEFSPDGNRLVIWIDNSNIISMVDAKSGDILWNISGQQASFPLAGSSITSLRFTPDGKSLLTGYSNGALEKLNVETGTRLCNFGYRMVNFDKIAFNNNDKLMTANQSSQINIWSLAAGNAKLLPDSIDQNNSMLFALSADLSTLMMRQNILLLFRDVQSGTEKSLTRFFSMTPPIISNDGSLACITTRDLFNNGNSPNSLTTLIYSINTGKVISTWKSTDLGQGQGQAIKTNLSGDMRFYLNITRSIDNSDIKTIVHDTFNNIATPAFNVPKNYFRSFFNNNGGDILLLSQKSNDFNDFELAMWNVKEQNWRWQFSIDKIDQNNPFKNTKNIPSYQNPPYFESRIFFTPDDKTVLIELRRGESLIALDVKSGEILWRSLENRKVRAISSNNLLTAVSDNGASPVMKILDTHNGTQIALLQGSAKIICAAFSRDNRWLAVGYADGAVVLWDAKSWRKLCQLYTFDDGNWAIIDPQGRYDTSNAGDIDTLRWVIGDEIIALRQLKERYYEPALLAKVLGYNDEPLRPVDDITDVKLFPTMTIIPPSADDTKLDITLTNRGGGIGTVKVLVNGKEFLADARGAKPDPAAKSARYLVNLAESATLQRGRENLIEVISTNADGNLSSRSNAFSFFAPGTAMQRQPELYAIIVGISDYAGDKLKLRFAARDAESMAKAITLGAKRLFGTEKVHINKLITGSTLLPTKANIQQAFKTMANQTNTDDILLVYLAGHGATLPSGNDTYCYLTNDAKNISDIADPVQRSKTAVTSDELRQWCTRIPALKQVMILDTCAAGAAAGTLIEKRDISGDQIRAIERLKDRTGFHILMGCAANARSYETSRYGQGLLTYSLLQGMKGAALREGQFIDVNTLFNYAADQVPLLAVGVGGLQRPMIATPKGNSFDIGQLTADDRGNIPVEISKPLLLRPVLMNIDSIGDPLELTELLRKSLQNNGDKWVFIDADTAPDGISLQGTYTIAKEIININIKMWKSEKELQNFTITGKKNKLSTLIDDIIKQMMLIKP
jgi:WD40 repeat protein